MLSLYHVITGAGAPSAGHNNGDRWPRSIVCVIFVFVSKEGATAMLKYKYQLFKTFSSVIFSKSYKIVHLKLSRLRCCIYDIRIYNSVKHKAELSRPS